MDIQNFIVTNPKLSIIAFAMIITLISTLVTKWLTNQEHLKSLKDKQKELQKDLKKCKPGDKKFEELQNEMLQISMTMMKSSFKPVLVTLVPFLILFRWIRGTYASILPSWFWYYLIASIVSSTIYRKIFKMA